MANEKNLKPLGNGQRTKEEERKIQSEGGKKSGEARRRKRDMKNAAKLLLGMKVDPKQSTMKATLQSLGIPEDEMNYQMAVLAMQLIMAGAGSTKAATFLRDTAGENPSVQIREKELKQRQKEFAQTQQTEGTESTLADAIEQAYEERQKAEEGGEDEHSGD